MVWRVLSTALPAGVAAGLLVSLLQFVTVHPLIEAAERIEQGLTTSASSEAIVAAPAPGRADRSVNAAERRAERRRTLLTLGANVLLGVGFGLFLSGAYLIHGGRVGLLRGFLWGLGGFAVFQVAPALGLPPALPGSPEAEVTARQVWWLGTVAASAVGLALVVFPWRNLLRGVGVVVILLPHLIGAPHLEQGVVSPLPPELIFRFILASLATTGVFWLFLGGLSGWLHSR